MEKYILFDLDGTLTDSAPGIINSVIYAAKKLGFPEPDAKTLKKFMGPPLAYSFERFAGLSGERIDEAVRAYREYFADRGIFENSVFPGIPVALDALKGSGARLAVATSKPEAFAVRILDRFMLSKYFDAVCGVPLNSSTVTKSEVISRSLDVLDVRIKSGALMVGDRSYDVAGAHQNGIKCVGVSYGYGGIEELKEAGADFIAISPADMADKILDI